MTDIDNDSLLSNDPIVLPVLASLKLTLVKSGKAKANGKDVIIANATIDNAGDYNPDNPAYIAFQIISGSATFEGTTAQKYVKKAVNMAWTASVHIVDTIGETGTIKAFLYTTDGDKYVTQDYTFINTLTGLKLERITQDGVQADGVATIAVQATLLDSQGVAAQGKNLVFALPSSVGASFTDTSTSLVLSTDEHGQAVAKVRAKSVNDVTVNVTCKLQDQDEPKANLDIHFKADVPIEQFTRLTLETTKNHATFGTGQQDEVLATLTDAKGAPGKNISLIFTLPQSSRANFINGTKSITVTTDEKGQVRVAVIAARDGSFTTTVTCIVELNAAVNANTDVVFETSIVTPTLILEATKSTAKAIDNDYTAVRAKIKLPHNSPTQHYTLGITLKNTPDRQEYLLFAANSSSDNASFGFLKSISTTGDETDVDVWIKYKNTNTTSNVSAVIVAELFYPKGSSREDDDPVVSNEVTVTFLAEVKPKPVTVNTEQYNITITSIRDNVNPGYNPRGGQGLGNIAGVRLTHNGSPVAGQIVRCGFAATGPNAGCKFANDDAQMTQCVSGNGSRQVFMRTDCNGEFSVTMAVWTDIFPLPSYAGTIFVEYQDAYETRIFHWH